MQPIDFLSGFVPGGEWSSYPVAEGPASSGLPCAGGFESLLVCQPSDTACEAADVVNLPPGTLQGTETATGKLQAADYSGGPPSSFIGKPKKDPVVDQASRNDAAPWLFLGPTQPQPADILLSGKWIELADGLPSSTESVPGKAGSIASEFSAADSTGRMTLQAAIDAQIRGGSPRMETLKGLRIAGLAIPAQESLVPLAVDAAAGQADATAAHDSLPVQSPSGGSVPGPSANSKAALADLAVRFEASAQLQEAAADQGIQGAGQTSLVQDTVQAAGSSGQAGSSSAPLSGETFKAVQEVQENSAIGPRNGSAPAADEVRAETPASSTRLDELNLGAMARFASAVKAASKSGSEAVIEEGTSSQATSQSTNPARPPEPPRSGQPGARVADVDRNAGALPEVPADIDPAGLPENQKAERDRIEVLPAIPTDKPARQQTVTSPLSTLATPGAIVRGRRAIGTASDDSSPVATKFESALESRPAVKRGTMSAHPVHDPAAHFFGQNEAPLADPASRLLEGDSTESAANGKQDSQKPAEHSDLRSHRPELILAHASARSTAAENLNLGASRVFAHALPATSGPLAGIGVEVTGQIPGGEPSPLAGWIGAPGTVTPADPSGTAPFASSAQMPRIIAAQLVAATDGRFDSWVSVRLEPDDLGPLAVRVCRTGDGLTAEIAAQEGQAVAWLEQNRELLLDSLRREGLDLESLVVQQDRGGAPAGQQNPDRTDRGEQPEEPSMPSASRPRQPSPASGRSWAPYRTSAQLDFVA